MRKHMTHGSLFSGIGGFDYAADMMGWRNAFHCEINEFCTKILKYHFPDAEHYDDITKTDFTRWRGRIDVLSGGFPCQPFSVAGQRKGTEDDRYLWPQMLRAIREIRPAWVVGENVAGILTMVQPGTELEVGREASLFGEDNRKRVLLRQRYVVDIICQDLEREGYSVQPFVIPACAVGAPHRRDRVWIVARRITTYGLLQEELLPTPQTQGLKVCNADGKTEFMPLELLSTPTSIDSGSGRINKSPSPGSKERPTIALAAKMGLLPTPKVQESRGNVNRDRGKRNLTDEISKIIPHFPPTDGTTSQLNPRFVAEMMGYPPDWTESPFLSGGRNQSRHTATP